ncbi:hypothetical protein [Roseobacter sp. HKCCA0434]|uniref:GspE/PulE/PilB domain-containing protein n=1 Tax=Roseobacter sp. HKCCA0434 TaxID=3079297 RepID=UPI003966AB79
MRAELIGIAAVSTPDLSQPTDLPDNLTHDRITRTGVVPVFKKGDLQIALVDPLDQPLLDPIQFLPRRRRSLLATWVERFGSRRSDRLRLMGWWSRADGPTYPANG